MKKTNTKNTKKAFTLAITENALVKARKQEQKNKVNKAYINLLYAIKETKEDNKKDFESLMRDYELSCNEINSSAYNMALDALAVACTYSVLKKVHKASANPVIANLKQSVVEYAKNKARAEYITLNNYIKSYNSNGKLETKVINKDDEKELNKIYSSTLGDGVELLQVASLAIISETQKAKERNANKLPKNFLELVYTKKQLKKKVYIKDMESVGAWELVNTTPIQEIYKAVRREIENTQSIKSASPKYIYLEDTVCDIETGEKNNIYRRLPLYADLGGYVTDFNGASTVYTVDAQSVTDYENALNKLKNALTTKQVNIIKLRFSGYGYKAIATYFGCSYKNIYAQIKAIQKKCIDLGIQPPKTATAKQPKTATAKQATATAKPETYIDYILIPYFESIKNKWYKEHKASETA